MYKGLPTRELKGWIPATRQQKYRMSNKVHSVQVSGMGDAPIADYYGPPLPGQSFSQYESFMKMPIAVGIGGAAIGMLVAGPVGAIVGGVGSWLLSSGSDHSNKPTTQGG
jgi:hypothetical protein